MNKNDSSRNMRKIKLDKTKGYFSFYMIYILFIFIRLTPNSAMNKRKDFSNYCILSYAYEITIKINGIGIHNITSSAYTFCPDNVIYNSVDIKEDCNRVNLPDDGNEIKTLTLKWNNANYFLARLFENITNILEVDLSNYDTTGVTDMKQMYYNCQSLTSINLQNIITSSTKDMRLMFGNCYILKSLDVSRFDTSQVTDMHFIFSYCKKIISLDVSKFNTENVEHFEGMFAGMESLKSINVQNFNTSSGINMQGMFYNCSSLTTLDVTNFDTSSVTDMSSMFYNVCEIISLELSNFDTTKVETMKYMFSLCRKIIKLDLSNFRTPNLKEMEAQFYENNKLISLNISNFNTTQVSSMALLFSGCLDLPFLDLSSFDTSNVYNMSYMFSRSNYLSSIEFSNFNTSSLKDCHGMFSYAFGLKSLDLTHFDTSQVIDMSYMFLYCWYLNDLKIANFDTSSVETMREMLSYCVSLSSLDLSNFDTTKVNNIFGMFHFDYNLKEINFPKIDTSSTTDMAAIFYNNQKLEYINIQNYNEMQGNDYSLTQSMDYVPENIVVCITSNVISKFKVVLQTKRCHTIYCGDDWKTKQKKMVYGTNLVCEQDCSNYKYEHNGWCYASCPENVDFCTPEDDIVETTSIATPDIAKSTSFIAHLSTQLVAETEKPSECASLQSANINPGTETPSPVPVSAETLDDNEPSVSTSAHQDHLSKGSTNIVDYPSDNISTNSANDLESTSAQISTESNNNIDKSSSIISDSLNNIPTEKNDDDSSNNISNNNISLVNNEALYQEIIDDYVKGSSVNDNEDKLFEGSGGLSYHLTTSKNDKLSISENHNNSKRVSRIDLGNCETILKNYYHINQNDSLIIVALEKVTNVSTERAMLYEVYEPYNKTKLNLSICDNTTISIFIPIVLSEELQNLYNQAKEDGYDIFDLNGAFFNDMCTPFTTPNGTDILLSDRVTYYFYNSETLCQSNCEFSNYDFETQYLECNCDTSNSEIPTKDIESFTPKTFYESFYDVLKFSNYKVLWCYKLAFHINSITINKGSIIAISLFLIYFIFLLIYCCKGIKSFQLSIAEKLKKNFIATKEDLNDANIKEFIEITDKNSKINDLNNIVESNTRRKIKSKRKSSKHIKNKNIQVLNINQFPPKKKNKSKSTTIQNNKQIQNIKNTRNKKKYSHKRQHKRQLSSEKNVLVTSKQVTFKESEELEKNPIETQNPLIEDNKLDNFELNNLDFDEALKLDKRSFFSTYWSLIQREHIIIFTFFIRNDYNLIYVKFARLIFLVCTDMTMNAFFFSDETMHRMFLDYGKYNFLLQITQIIISTVISQIMEVFICFLSLTDKHFYEIKNMKKKDKDKMLSILQCVKRKITLFYIITFIMFAFYWYSIACFCAVYRNTQIAFIKNSLSSFALGLLYPFILYLFPALLRIISLKADKAKLSCLYKTSDLIPFF